MLKLGCKICGNKHITTLTACTKYFFCSNCQVAWLKKFPRNEYKESYYRGGSGLAQKLFWPISLLFYKIRQVYVSSERKGTWIDVGAGEGGFLSGVNAARRIGVEVSESARSMMKKAGLETLSDRQFLHKTRLKADVISFWHMLEYVEKPWEYLAAARNNLGRQGKIVIGVPNVDSNDFYFFGRDWFHLVPEFHLWLFSPKSINFLLTKNGFRTEKIDYWSPEHHLTGILQSFIN